MNYYLDTEFIEDGKTIDLISIGVVSEDNRELYLQNIEVDLFKASPWVKENVFPSLQGLGVGEGVYTKDSRYWVSRREIKNQLLSFIGDDKPSFWGYYSSYDWVCLCQLFGTMMDLPKHFHLYCLDLKQLVNQLGNFRLPKPPKRKEHNALEDAKWIRDSYLYIKDRIEFIPRWKDEGQPLRSR